LDDKKWYKFNDSVVSEIKEDFAFNIGMGGYTSTFGLKERDQQTDSGPESSSN
jgi:hypothetical protein